MSASIAMVGAPPVWATTQLRSGFKKTTDNPSLPSAGWSHERSIRDSMIHSAASVSPPSTTAASAPSNRSPRRVSLTRACCCSGARSDHDQAMASERDPVVSMSPDAADSASRFSSCAGAMVRMREAVSSMASGTARAATSRCATARGMAAAAEPPGPARRGACSHPRPTWAAHQRCARRRC